MRVRWWWVVALSLLVVTPAVVLAPDAVFSRGTPDPATFDWPSFVGVYQVENDSGQGLVSTRWRIDWPSKQDWSLWELRADGQTVLHDRAHDGFAPNSWLWPGRYTDEGIAARTAMSRHDLDDGTIELVELMGAPCMDHSPLLRCAPGRTSKTERTVIRLDEHRVPISFVSSYDGQVTYRVRFLDVDWR